MTLGAVIASRLRDAALVIGCGFAVVLPVAVLTTMVMTLRWWSLAVVAAAVVLLVLLSAWYRWQRRLMVRRFLREHDRTEALFVVYSDSPHWQPYIEENWIPRWGDHLILFNRSRPWRADQSEARLWRKFIVGLKHTPMAITLGSDGSATAIELFRAFRDYKHGRIAGLAAAEERIEAAMRDWA